QTMFDITVRNLHTFVVWTGTAGVLVHNSTPFCDLSDLVRPDRREHILTGEEITLPDGSTVYSGGHHAGTGFPDPRKTEFPAYWTDDQVIHYVSDVATDPNSEVLYSGPVDRMVKGWRDNVEIQVLIRNNEIWTAFPLPH